LNEGSHLVLFVSTELQYTILGAVLILCATFPTVTV
jgi:hypothetical protein